jgi:23S rRNA (pseudouridine1915-N3)-methyltransferase
MGTRMPAWVDAGVAQYLKRLGGDIRLTLEEVPLPRRGNEPVTSLMEREADLLRKRLGRHQGAHRVALDAGGREMSTEQLAQRLDGLRQQSQDLVLLIGGPDGLAPSLTADTHERWSLSRLTLPHPLVRVMVAEQLYRCWSLLQGHPYHR